MSRKNDVGDPMPMRLQTSHRLMSLPSLINANYWTLSRTSRCRELIDIFSTSVRFLPAQVDPMVIEIVQTKWEAPCNRLSP